MNEPLNRPDEIEPSVTRKPADLGMELFEKGFTKPVVIDALVADGVEREVAREIVSNLQKARFRMKELERIAARRYQSRVCMLGGAAIFICSFLWLYYTATGSRKCASVQLGLVAGGFFLFLYGFAMRKRF